MVRMITPNIWSLIRKGRILLGGCMMMATFGTAYTFGNMNPYITSYLRHTGVAPTLTYTECSWIYVSSLMAQAVLMPVVGLVEKRLGMRATLFLGALVFCVGVTSSYFSIRHSFGALVLTYGVVFGVGVGLAYMIPMTCAMRWMSDNPGLATGVVNGGIGCGALIFNMVQTAFINPDNLQVPEQEGQEKYFDQDEMLDRVPDVFLLLGLVFAIMNLTSVLLLKNPPAKEIPPLPTETEDTAAMPLLEHAKRPSKPEHKMPEEEEGLSPREVLKTPDFYLLFFTFFFNGLGVVFLNSLYKAFGLSFINDDVFLTTVGTISAVFNFVSRIFWGHIADLSSFRVATMTMSTIFTAFILTFQVTVYASRYLFLVYMCVLMWTCSGTFSLIPAAMAKRFGKKHVTTNYGMIFFSQAFIAPMTVLISQTLLEALGWTGLFFAIAILSYAGVILAWRFNAKDKNGRDI